MNVLQLYEYVMIDNIIANENVIECKSIVRTNKLANLHSINWYRIKRIILTHFTHTLTLLAIQFSAQFMGVIDPSFTTAHSSHCSHCRLTKIDNNFEQIKVNHFAIKITNNCSEFACSFFFIHSFQIKILFCVIHVLGQHTAFGRYTHSCQTNKHDLNFFIEYLSNVV